MISKNFFKNRLIKDFAIFLIIFFLADILYSNFINKNHIKSNCISLKENFYFLEKNCFFKQKYIRNVNQYNVFTNEFGLRYSGKKFDKNKENIFYFGDSYTYGLGLDYKKIYVGILEKKLEKYNHLNFGLQGYSPKVYKYQLNKMINDNIFPKKIILALDFTDIFENDDRWIDSLDKKKPPIINEKFIQNKNESKKEVKSFKEKNLKVTKFIAQFVNGFFRSLRLSIKNSLDKEKNTSVEKTQIGSFIHSNNGELFKEKSLIQRSKNLKQTLLEISKISKEINSEFYVLIYPWPDTLEYGQSNFNWERYVSDFCKMNCTKSINTFPLFFDYKKKNLFWFKDIYIKEDLHFSAFGNSLIAKEILKVIK